jgi:hypothetical protein
MKVEGFLDQLNNYHLLRKDSCSVELIIDLTQKCKDFVCLYTQVGSATFPELRMLYYILQLAVDEFFAIPSCVLLPEDLPQIAQYTKEDEQQLDKEIKQLEVRAKRVCSNTVMLRTNIIYRPSFFCARACVCVCFF